MKPKNPENNLILAMVACLIFGLMPIIFTLRCYLKNQNELPSKVDWHNADSVLIWGQAQLLHELIYQLMPILGGAFLFIGFLIWDYRRKKKV
ncbi:MAG TPA: hypothetical protein VFC85_08675 [Verrucomicrobiae bacterium]|nr:hypothetical protein [Verrucomicrobiae bacterium]